MNKEKSLSFKSLALALLVMALWGSLFPMIKIGYGAFGIDTSVIPDIIVFASLRFLVSGAVVCIIARVRKAPIERPFKKSVLPILGVAAFTIFLHYMLTYVGLSVTDSSKTALLKQIASLVYVCFAFLFIRSETFNPFKIVGAVIGFLGIVAINFDGKGVHFAPGDLIILGASVMSVVGMVFSKKSVERASSFWVTGISQLLGGAALLLVGLIMGGRFPQPSFAAILVFLYICTASISAYVLHGYIQKTESNSRLLIIKFAEPLFACLFGALFLGEEIFKWQYLIAFILISVGIVLGGMKKEKRVKICKK